VLFNLLDFDKSYQVTEATVYYTVVQQLVTIMTAIYKVLCE